MHSFRRVTLVVLDGVGIGEMPDAARWNDAGSDSLGHVLSVAHPHLPNLQKLGLGNIRALPNLPAAAPPLASFGKGAILSNGKDTTVGHWEMAGILTSEPFPTYPGGFPAGVLEAFQEAIGRQVLGNFPASGTEIIRELGAQHMRTGQPIVYTSADSVFQIAAHEEVIPVDELYCICRIARRLLDGPDRVARVIARPFVGTPGNFRRTGNRRDFAVPPPGDTLLDDLKRAGLEVVAVGKVASIFDGRGITQVLPAHDNAGSVEGTRAALKGASAGLIFSNFGDFDTLWGHRNDAAGFALGLEAFDQALPELCGALGKEDCLVLTADHGCDPTMPGTDHSREYVPILVYAKTLAGGVDLGTRGTLADVGQTIATNFGLRLATGISFLEDLQ